MSKKHIEILARGVCMVQGQVLLCQSRGAANTYLPGGHIEFREPARTGLAREIAEELGCRATIGKFLGCVEHTFRQKGVWHAEINLVFAMRIPGLTPAKPTPSCEKWISFKWVPLSQLQQARLEPAVLLRHLPDWLASSAGFASSRKGWN